MSSDSRPTRRCKREVAFTWYDDEPTSSKRAMESAKGDETETGPSLAELQASNRKLMESLERVCRVAHENELRAERAEKQIESKQAMIDGSKRVRELEETVASLKKQLEEERKQRSEERERDGKKIDELTFQLTKHALGIEKPPQPQPVVDKVPDHNSLTLIQQLFGEEAPLRFGVAAPPVAVQQPPQLPVVERPPLFGLAARPLAVQQPQPQPLTLQQLLQQNADEAARAAAPAGGEKLHESGHPTNILQMCRPDMPYSMSLADAVIKLSGPYKRCGPGNFFKNCYVARNMKFSCEACGRTLNKFSFLGHFFKDAHANKVASHGGGVSIAAVNYWARVLSAVAATPKMAAAGLRTRAAGAAAPAAAAAAVLSLTSARIAAARVTAAAAGAVAAAGLDPTAANFHAQAALAAAGPSRTAARQAAAFARLAAKAAEVAAAAPRKVKKEEGEE